jgi:hypothetical protein
LFGNDSHGIARNPNISTFTDVNDVVMFTAGSGSVGLVSGAVERLRVLQTATQA